MTHCDCIATQCTLLLFKHFDMPYLFTHRGSPWKHHCNNLPPCLLCCHGSHPRIVPFCLSLPRVYDSQPAGETTIQPVSHDVPPLRLYQNTSTGSQRGELHENTKKCGLGDRSDQNHLKGGWGEIFLYLREFLLVRESM